MQLWLVKRFVFQKKVLTDTTTLFSLLGIALGVAFLIVCMAGFSGFETALKQAIIDISGDIVVYKRNDRISNPEAFEKKIRENSAGIKNMLPYVKLESLVANKGKIKAIMLQGIDGKLAHQVLNLESRMNDKFVGKETPPGTPAYLGKEIVKHLGLKVGDVFRVILPKTPKSSSTAIIPQVEKFYLQAVMDFGKFEYNERVILTDIKTVQKFGNMGERVNGFRIALHDSKMADLESAKIEDLLSPEYAVVGWKDFDRNLFKAIKYEKQVLFFVMLIMVVAAFFNVSTTLFLNVLRRYSQVSILKTLGVQRRHIIAMFCLNGLFLGTLGLALGIALGFLFCLFFEKIQTVYPIIPADVYKLTFVMTEVRVGDIISIAIATLVICLISSLAPAFRGARLSPVEGLKYE